MSGFSSSFNEEEDQEIVQINKVPVPSELFDHEKFKQGDEFKIRITHVYDLSKFWITTKYRELELFQKYLFKTYYNHESEFILTMEEIKCGTYCVVFDDQAYYRSLILSFVHNHKKENEIQVLNIDFGVISCVSRDRIFRISSTLLKIPRFAIRATLFAVCPATSNDWKTRDYERFLEICGQNVLLMHVFTVDFQQKILKISLWHLDGTHINRTLYSEETIRYFHEKENTHSGKESKYTYLFPSHKLLESGKVPRTISDTEYLFCLQSAKLV